ncbi:type II secretion system F family protein [archaeon]|nr:type II secretion system F family protein [archaeon]
MIKTRKLYLGRKWNDKIKLHFTKSGINKTPSEMLIRLLIIGFILSFLGILAFWDYISGYTGTRFFLTLFSYWVISLVLTYAIVMFLFYSYVAYKKYQRRIKLEEVLSDYLQLVAANVGAGLTIDQALWYAIRERFGVLAEEMEIVAKKTMVGFKLNDSLLSVSAKYDSKVLERSMVVLVEGLEAGGEISDLIRSVSWTIKENQLLQKEIAADVTTYAIFIVFASLIVAPVLFALSHRIIVVIGNIMSNIDISNIGAVSTKLPIANIGQGIKETDFKIFAYVSLMVSAFFSAITVAAIKTGSEKSGFRVLPVYIVVALVIFLLASLLLSSVFGSLGITF